MGQLPPDPRGFRAASTWFPLVREVASFGTGIGLLISETTHPDVRPLVIGAALLLAGYPIAAVLDRAIGEGRK